MTRRSAEPHAGASSAPAGAAGSLDWTLRLYQASPFGAGGTGLLLVLAYALLALLYRALTGTLDVATTTGWGRFGWDVVNGLLIVLPLSANAYAQRAGLRDLRALRPSVNLPDGEMAQEIDSAVRPPRLWLEGLSGAGVCWMALVVFFDVGLWDEGVRPPFSSPALYWALFHNLGSAYAVGRMLALEASLTRSFARVAARLRVDLLAPQKLHPIARKGQRSVMLWLLLSSLITSFYFGGGPAFTNGFILALLLGVAATAFFLPLARARRCIATARDEELRRVNERIALEHAALFAGSGGEAGRIGDLLAWRGVVESVHEWPVTAPILLRSVLFLGLGLGSWIGGAVVERLLGMLLG